MDEAVRAAVGSVVPRFALVEPASARISMRLAALGWHPAARAADVARLGAAGMAAVEVLAVVCTERQLLTPAFQSETERVAGTTPRVAIIVAPGPEAAAYAARLGWKGFVATTSPTGTIARTIAAAARGELAFPQSAMTSLVRTLARVAPVGSQTSGASLTPRQQQIVTLIAQGATDGEIATVLSISRSTAHKHVQNARRRLQAKTRGQLVAASRDLALMGTDRLVAIPAWRAQ